MYNSWAFEDPRRPADTHFVVPVCFRDKELDSKMGFDFAQAVLDQFRRDGSDLLPISSCLEQSQFIPLPGGNKSDDAVLSRVRSGKEEAFDAVVAVKADD